MRRFKFIGTEEEAEEYPRIIPEVGKIYSDEDEDGYNFEVLSQMKWFGEEWEEVFEEKTKSASNENEASKATTRKFKFIGTEKEADEYWGHKPEVGKVYSGSDIVGSSTTTVQGWFDEKFTRHEWEEVFEETKSACSDPFPEFPKTTTCGGLLGEFTGLGGRSFSIDFTVAPEGTLGFYKQPDPTNPSHYKQGDIECIDAIKSAISDKVGVEAAYSANIIKYVWRYKGKNGIEDLKKAKWYLEKLIEEVQNA